MRPLPKRDCTRTELAELSPTCTEFRTIGARFIDCLVLHASATVGASLETPCLVYRAAAIGDAGGDSSS